DAGGGGGLGEAVEALELPPPPLGDQRAQLAAQVGEEEEGLGRAPLLPHEEKGQRRSKENDGGCRAHGLRGGEPGDALAEGPVANLVMVLEKVHEARGGQGPTLLPTGTAPLGGPPPPGSQTPREGPGGTGQGGRG